jgi:3-oxoacyl-[acyl-carrier-protein] synthase-3
LPERIVTSADLEAELGIAPGWIERVTGVRERRYATHETALTMGVAAACRALAAAGIRAADLDLIIAGASAPLQAIPCSAALLQASLGAPDGRSACFDVNATCLSFLVALQTAAHLIAAGVHQTALVVSSEVAAYSRNPRERASAVLFGDAAAAAIVVRAGPGQASAVWGARVATHGSGACLTQVRGGGTLHHPNDPATTPEMNMFAMDGPGVFKKTARLVKPFLDAFLAQIDWAYADVHTLVPHQTSRHGLEHLTTRLDFRAEQVVINLAERGNCIAASIPLALSEAVQAGRIARGQRVLLAGSGAGLTLGALALTF